MWIWFRSLKIVLALCIILVVLILFSAFYKLKKLLGVAWLFLKRSFSWVKLTVIFYMTCVLSFTFSDTTDAWDAFHADVTYWMIIFGWGFNFQKKKKWSDYAFILYVVILRIFVWLYWKIGNVLGFYNEINKSKAFLVTVGVSSFLALIFWLCTRKTKST